ncbi:hypothetical protein I553_2947 [Mycobacterium xenopi 4042]|uniref:Uncharacterized protein n=1 Tax=Mycobacterium xenopi 4042 TaxID=1299334 RepID=X8EEN7_MYCXE|nr:hypothetical protein I552_3295 [Mycobacterium xenopi 3993]EUA78656.1 hypothetical protein I553_2947 [Mycobacterium xenopi 4042]
MGLRRYCPWRHRSAQDRLVAMLVGGLIMIGRHGCAKKAAIELLRK